ncbi:MAG: hypothetical protein NVS3B24_14630 [Candidatus Dormibacteria bacterium]
MLMAIAGDAVFWHWLERLSWVVTVFGFPLAALAALDQVRQVRAEQERIVQELGSRANVFVGFRPVAARHKSIGAIHHAGHARNIPELPRDTQVRARFCDGAARSEPAEIGIFTYNHGPRTAHNLLWNIIVPAGIDCAHIKHSHVEYSSDPDGCTRIIRRAENLHPEVVFREGIRVKLPRGMEEFEISVTLSLEDVPTMKVKLSVRVANGSDEVDNALPRAAVPVHGTAHQQFAAAAPAAGTVAVAVGEPGA